MIDSPNTDEHWVAIRQNTISGEQIHELALKIIHYDWMSRIDDAIVHHRNCKPETKELLSNFKFILKKI